MEHLAILNQPWLNLILNGQKTIESRWYVPRIPPMVGNRKYSDGIIAGDMVYLKESGKPVCAKAVVEKALFFENIDEQTLNEIAQYSDKMGFTPGPEMLEKNYCVLVFLQNVEQVEPFNIDKTGYGNAAAWLTVKSIDDIRVA